MQGPPSSAAKSARAPLVAVLIAIASTRAWAAPPKAKPVLAGPKDKAAQKLDDEALARDYLETNFIRAEKRLQQAISMCAKGACADKVIARLHRDLALIYIAGLGKSDACKAELKAALEWDPALELDPEYATPDLKRAFDQVRGVKPKPGAEEKPTTRRAPAGKGISHAAVAEQLPATPIPIYAESGDPSIVRIKLWYRRADAERWSSVDLTKTGSGFGGAIPCQTTGSRGKVEYFLEALGDDDRTLDKSGTRKEPHEVAITKELTGKPPHLPDADPPEVCKDLCTGDGCDDVEDKGPHVLQNLITLSIQQDFAAVGGLAGVCTPEVQVFGSYSCFRAAGDQYLGDPLSDPSDNVAAGVTPATTRILLGYDRVLVAGLTLGLRFGYVLRGLGPRADGQVANTPLPWHLEGRLAYWFGSDVFSTAGFRPFLFAGGGLAQVDAAFDVTVHENPSVAPPPAQTDNPPTQSLTAYRRMGQAFVGGGVGVMYAFTPRIGLFVDAKYMLLVPTIGSSISPEAGVGVGF